MKLKLVPCEIMPFSRENWKSVGGKYAPVGMFEASQMQGVTLAQIANKYKRCHHKYKVRTVSAWYPEAFTRSGEEAHFLRVVTYKAFFVKSLNEFKDYISISKAGEKEFYKFDYKNLEAFQKYVDNCGYSHYYYYQITRIY